MNCNYVFMGTGPFALCALEGLWEHLEEGDRLSVYTKAAKKQGRGMKTQDGCVALFAKEKGLPLYQPHSLKDDEEEKIFCSLKPTLVIVASYGLLLPKYVLQTPRYGCINIHASLLPKYRGAAPIQRAILNGDTKTGITMMQMDEGLDTGDILLQKETSIGETETAGELFDRLAVMGKDMMLSLIPSIFAGTLSPVKQDGALSSYASKIAREDQALDFSETCERVLCRIRALSPTPGAICRTEKDGKLIKIFSAEKSDASFAAPSGKVLAEKKQVLVKCADGAILLGLVQPEGKGKMTAQDAANGRKLTSGDVLIP